MSKKAIVLESNQEEIDKLTKKWEKVRDVGDRAFKISSSGFIITVLSPFDFEGPVAEIITAVAAVGGFVTKKIAESKLEELKGEKNTWTEQDDKDLDSIAKNFGNIKKKNGRNDETARDLANEKIEKPEPEDSKGYVKS